MAKYLTFNDKGMVSAAVSAAKAPAKKAGVIKENKDARQHGIAAVAHNRAGNIQAELAERTRAIEIDPANPDYHYWRGAVYIRLGEYDKAIIDCTEAIRLNNDKDYADHEIDMSLYHDHRGKARCGLEDYQGAIDDYTQALNIAPWSTRSMIGRGDVYMALKEYNAALADYTLAVEHRRDKEAIAKRDEARKLAGIVKTGIKK